MFYRVQYRSTTGDLDGKVKSAKRARKFNCSTQFKISCHPDPQRRRGNRLIEATDIEVIPGIRISIGLQLFEP